MDKNGIDFYKALEKLFVGIGTTLGFAYEILRGVGENIGIVKDRQGGKTDGKPTNVSDVPVDLARAGMVGWDGAALRRAAIPAIIVYVNGAEKIARGIEKIDTLAGMEQGENGKWLTRAVFAIAIAIIPGGALEVAGLAPARVAKPAQKKKPQEKTAPRKASGMEMHKNDTFYKMAFSRPLPKSTFVAAPQPASQKGQRVASRLS